MTDFTLRVTIIVPEADMDDANALAACLANGPGDLETFRSANWQDTSSNLYAVASTLAKPQFQIDAASPLTRPEWDDEPYQVNMTGAERAQAKLVIYDPEAPVQADPQAAVALAGVSRMDVEA